MGESVDEKFAQALALVVLGDGNVFDVAAQAGIVDQFLFEDDVSRGRNLSRCVLDDDVRVVLSNGGAVEIDGVPKVDDLFEAAPRDVPDDGQHFESVNDSFVVILRDPSDGVAGCHACSQWHCWDFDGNSLLSTSLIRLGMHKENVSRGDLVNDGSAVFPS